MKGLFSLNEGALQKVHELSELLAAKAWGDHSRQGLVSALSQCLEKLSELKVDLEKAEKIMGEETEPRLRQHIVEMEKEISVLERRLEFEKKKKPLDEQLLLPERFSEQYSALEQRVRAQLLKTRYLVERLQLIEKKQEITPIREKSTAKNLLDLLKAKENEIELLKEKYGNARKQALTGITETVDSAAIEEEMNSLARKMEVQQNDLEKAYFESQNGLEAMQSSNIVLRKEVREMQQVFTNYLAKTLELVTLLKKERNYAQKVFMETEHETMQLRSSYSKELLSLQEQKVALKKEAEEKFLARMKKIENENKQQQQLISQLQSMLQLREKKLEWFEEKNHGLRLLLKTKEKHEAVKKAFLSKSAELEMQE